ncbi:MAG TPA: hypothetical protein GX707_03880 [Epulopiscium sp.]|nr:hypothetical protein [Candidatus Epulonipiscium sp.]
MYHLETYDLPYGCPYRQMVPFGPQGPGFGPQGPGFGPQGPGFGPQGPGFGPQGQNVGSQGSPSSPPPNFTPTKSTKSSQTQGASTKFVDPGTIRPCVFRFVYIWPTRGNGFWAWLTYVGRRSVSGFRWNGRRWVYFGMDLRGIDSFECF